MATLAYILASLIAARAVFQVFGLFNTSLNEFINMKIVMEYIVYKMTRSKDDVKGLHSVLHIFNYMKFLSVAMYLVGYVFIWKFIPVIDMYLFSMVWLISFGLRMLVLEKTTDRIRDEINRLKRLPGK